MSALPVQLPDDLQGVRHVGVSEFRADPIGTTHGEPVVVTSYDRPALLVLPLMRPVDPDQAVALADARFAAKMEVIRSLRTPEHVAAQLRDLQELRDADETLAEQASRLDVDA